MVYDHGFVEIAFIAVASVEHVLWACHNIVTDFVAYLSNCSYKGVIV